MTLVLATVAIYAAAGAVPLRRPVSDFYVAGRLVPGLLNGVALAIGLVPMLAFTGFAGVLEQGVAGAILLALGCAAGLVAAGLFLAPYLRKFGGYSIPDFLGERFPGTGVRALAVLGVVLCSFPALAVVLMALGGLSARVFEVDAASGIALSGAMLLLCTMAAGQRSASLTQIAQYAVLLAAWLLALALIYWQRGALLPPGGGETEAVLAPLVQIESFAAQDSLNRFALLFSLGAGAATLPHLLLRSFLTSSVSEARASFFWALPFAAALGLVAALCGPLFGVPPAGELPLEHGLLVTGAIAACLGAGTGLALALSSALSYDICDSSLHRTAATGQRIFIARVSLVLVLGLAAWGALAAPQALAAMAGSAFSLAASAFLPALVLGIWWKRTSGEGAMAGMLGGLVVCLYYMLAPRYIPITFYETSSFLSDASSAAAARYAELRQSYYLTDEAGQAAVLSAWEATAQSIANWGGVRREFAAVFAVPVAILTAIGVSLFTPAPSRDVQSFVQDLRSPQTA